MSGQRPMRHIGYLLLALCTLVIAACSGRATSANPNATSEYTVLSPNLKHLQDDFNAHVGSVRLLYIVGPTCPECLRGMDDLGKALAADRDDPRLNTFVVYVPALGAKASDIQATLPLMPGKQVFRYWDPAGSTGRLFDGVLKTGGFAWDVWMIYGPEQRWDGAQPPAPEFWMDQLGGLPEWRYLDAAKFAKQVANRLALVKANSK